jgi:solute carrier family 25 oxoglutarate transporter 11
MASTACHPLDVVRVQLQTDAAGGTRLYRGPLDAGLQIFRRGGVGALWAGLSAAYLRQFSYSAVRIGLYSYLLDASKRRQQHSSTGGGGGGDNIPFSTKLLLGSVAGVVGSVVGNPAELAIVRMANDSRLPPTERRNYRSSLHACVRMVQEEGFTGLGRGVVNSSLRAAVLNGFQLGTYSQAKEVLVETSPALFTSPNSIPTMFVGATFSAFLGVGASMPLDVVKSR